MKTSAGFHPKGGATVQALGWLPKYVPGLGVKASGGIKDPSIAEATIAAGTTRPGTISGIAIVKGLAPTQSY